MRNDSPELKKALAAFMKTHGPGTTFGNVVIQRYTRDNRWVRNPGTTEDLRRFKEALPYFQKYAKQYEFDYLLIAAQAYQESRINQKLKSPAGAVGVMQIKPTTASDPNVRIANVSAMDSNVHAGVKYLRFVSDRYFSDAKFDELNRHVFAFAAYNAGPARIQELRTAAAKEGLDPNEWFNNVEIIAGRKIGRETVDYVRNILKYWVAYHLALDQDEDCAATGIGQVRPRGEQVAHRAVYATLLLTAAVCLLLAACAAPLVPYSTDTPPLVLAPAALAGVIDKRATLPRNLLCRPRSATESCPTIGAARKP